ncbi:MAG: ABC transporter ATP-binding protein [Clostridiales bacterium]|nr:ABC transporter ATP-binding protein [Clostridiales bacterium]
MDEILKLNKVSLTYQSDNAETKAIKDLSFSVKETEFVSIIGPSGCGKTTVLSLIAGLLNPTDGNILYKGEDISKTNDNIGYMLQRDELFSWRNIEKNVLLPLEIKKINTKENRENALFLIEKYGLKDFVKSYPNQLSGGMRQRVALIRTLAPRPDLLLLDEPFSALDSQTRLKVNGDVYSIIRSENKTAILVTHDIAEAISLSDKIIVLSKRPATVYKEHVLDFDKNLPPIKRREDKKFSQLFETLWRELNDEN